MCSSPCWVPRTTPTRRRGGARAWRELDGPGSARAVEISVADQGSGMTPEVARRALEPFFTTKPLGKGTGLGLSMVKGFVEQSSGRLEVQTTEGVGTTIRLVFPRVQVAR